jgi:hypothetical protein
MRTRSVQSRRHHASSSVKWLPRGSAASCSVSLHI